LGLASSRNLVIRMGGSIDFNTALGEGTIFRFSFASPIYHQKLGEEKVENLPFSQSRKILVVDDCPLNLKVLMSYLNQLGWTCDVAYDGKEAVLLIEENNYGLVFMDIQMSVMNGIEATKKLRENNISVPIIAISATVTYSESKACTEAGMNDFLIKPTQRKEIGRIMARYLGIDL